MSMNPIEAAAREIARKFVDDSEDASNEIERAEITAIIARHLFPVVKPDDVVAWRLYYFKTATMDWFVEGGGWAKKLCDIVEIRGPIPDQPWVKTDQKLVDILRGVS